MISIGRLGAGRSAADYYLRRQAGCPADYYTGEGERRGVWIGAGARGLGLVGELDEAGEERLRALLAGRDTDGRPLVAPVRRLPDRARLPLRPLVEAITRKAAEKQVSVERLIADPERAGEFARFAAAVDRDRSRARLPRAAAPATRIAVLAAAVGVDATGLYRQPNGVDRFATALAAAEERVDVRRAGLDVCFSPPKSVSVLYGLSGSAVAEQVRSAHETAVAEAVGYLERRCATALRGHHDGASALRIGTDGLIGVAFEHRASRAEDLQLHTHVVLVNLVRGVDGRFSALDTRAVYAEAFTAGHLYQAVLRGQLTANLGVGWSPVRHGIADIRGVPIGLRRLFSRRRAEIEAELDRVGRDDPKAAHVATLVTRPAKRHRGETSLREEWTRRSVDAGFDPAELTEVLHRITPPDVPAADVLADRLFAPHGLTFRRASFDRRGLLRGLCDELPAGANVTVERLRTLATELIRDPQVVALAPELPADVRRYSTVDMLRAERDALALARSRRKAAVGMVPAATVDAAITGAGLSGEQAQVVRSLTSSGAGVQVLVGPAGSGKTRALAAARTAWQQAGHPVLGAALAAIAAQTLHDGAGICASSLARLLMEVNRVDPDTHSPVGLPAGAVLVVDEAGMVGTRQLLELMRLTTAADGKLVLVGDPCQLPEIDAGGLFAVLSRGPAAERLGGNQRQQQRWEIDALTKLRDGDVATAVDAYLAHGRVHATPSTRTAQEQLVADYLADRRTAGPGRIVAITSRRVDTHTLNAAIRGALIEHDLLGDAEIVVTAELGQLGLRVGEEVVVTANDYRCGLLNGTRGQITALHPRAGRIELTAAGRTHTLDGQWCADHLIHGYALTSHRAQGITVETALVYGSTALCREAGYVGMSRGRRANHLYTSLGLVDPDPEHHVDHPRLSRIRSDEQAELLQAALTERLLSSRQQRMASSEASGPGLTLAAARLDPSRGLSR
ncbi:MAG TPA: MobF family relaxase [Mycobacteriales bacterium]|nr:MobF family relaxase [Mycobacteriales bacterium]